MVVDVNYEGFFQAVLSCSPFLGRVVFDEGDCAAKRWFLVVAAEI